MRYGKFFECGCTRCCDPTECGTYLSAFKCQKCAVGNVLPLKPLDDDSPWVCDRCPYRLTSSVITKVTNRLKEEYDGIGFNDVQQYVQ